MRKGPILVVMVAAVIAAVVLLTGGPGPTSVRSTERGEVAKVVQVDRETRPGETRAEARARRVKDQAAPRAALHERITAAMAARESQAGRRVGGEEEVEAAAVQAKEAAKEGEAEAPAMIDRTGKKGYLTQVMSRDLLPLADECYELARERKPDLAGMLVMEVEILSDEEHGGVVDAAEPGQTNELADAELIECVRESLLATTLPPPPSGGRDAVMLSMRFSPDPK